MRITQIIGYGETPREKGVIIMDTPGFDISSVTGKVAGPPRSEINRGTQNLQ